MSTDVTRQSFFEDGFVNLRGAVATSDAAAMRERIWHLLEHRGAARDDPSTWSPAQATHLQNIRKRGDGDPHSSPVVVQALDAVFGAGQWTTKPNWGQALVTFPTPAPWQLPARPWHLDHPYDQPAEGISGANLFLFVDDVEPRGGGTLVLRGSPLLIGSFVAGLRPAKRSMRQLRETFERSHPYLAALGDRTDDSPDRAARFMDADGDVDGVATRVVELTGQAGDAVLCHPWCVHNVSPNASDRPRMMRASRVYSRAWLSLMLASDDDAAIAAES